MLSAAAIGGRSALRPRELEIARRIAQSPGASCPPTRRDRDPLVAGLAGLGLMRPSQDDWHGRCVVVRPGGTRMRAERLALEPIVDRCRHSDDGSDCFREGNAYRVRLWGGLPDGWAGNFALHACALGLEIVSGEAICVDSARWAATFVVRTADPHAR